MSSYYNDYIITSNNSINENKYNNEKLAKSPSHKIKKILKPILRLLRQKSKTSKTDSSRRVQSMDFYDYHTEIDDNLANEHLENEILEEMADCENDAAIYVYNNNECSMQLVQREQTFVPVHFARTEAGTFFWTTMQRTFDYEDDCYNLPHSGDRWVQA